MPEHERIKGNGGADRAADMATVENGRAMDQAYVLNDILKEAGRIPATTANLRPWIDSSSKRSVARRKLCVED